MERGGEYDNMIRGGVKVVKDHSQLEKMALDAHRHLTELDTRLEMEKNVNKRKKMPNKGKQNSETRWELSNK